MLYNRFDAPSWQIESAIGTKLVPIQGKTKPKLAALVDDDIPLQMLLDNEAAEGDAAGDEQASDPATDEESEKSSTSGSVVPPVVAALQAGQMKQDTGHSQPVDTQQAEVQREGASSSTRGRSGVRHSSAPMDTTEQEPAESGESSKKQRVEEPPPQADVVHSDKKQRIGHVESTDWCICSVRVDGQELGRVDDEIEMAATHWDYDAFCHDHETEQTFPDETFVAHVDESNEFCLDCELHEVEHVDLRVLGLPAEVQDSAGVQLLKLDTKEKIAAANGCFSLGAWHNSVEMTYVVKPSVWFDGDEYHEPKLSEAAMEILDKLSDNIELKRLEKMKDLEEPTEQFWEQNPKCLTTKMVRTVRRKEGRWMRRSRLVAREYNFLEVRDDLYAPSTNSQILKIVPHMFVSVIAEDPQAEARLIGLDFKDAFLMVPQSEPLYVIICDKQYKVSRMLPGQRAGTRDWFDHLILFLR